LQIYRTHRIIKKSVTSNTNSRREAHTQVSGRSPDHAVSAGGVLTPLARLASVSNVEMTLILNRQYMMGRRYPYFDVVVGLV
jgi:hypothetical protein